MRILSRTHRCSLVFWGISGLMLVAFGGMAQAHVLKEDHGISAVLHIPPDDNPVAGQTTRLYLSFGDVTDTFSLANCDCGVELRRNGQTVLSAPLRPALKGATLGSVATVDFPVIGVYDVIAKGTAKDGSFPAFRLDYLVRVASAVQATQAAKPKSGSAALILGSGSLAVLGMVAYNNVRSGRRYRPPVKIKTKQQPK